MVKCKHTWNFIDKWTDGELTYWEFFCENCLDIRITNNKRGFKLHENENEAKDSR